MRIAISCPQKELTVCREPADGWRLNRCTRVPDTRAADMVDLVCEHVAGNVRQTLSQLSHSSTLIRIMVSMNLLQSMVDG